MDENNNKSEDFYPINWDLLNEPMLISSPEPSHHVTRDFREFWHDTLGTEKLTIKLL